MRDDLFVLTRAQRRRARQVWGEIPFDQRLEAVRLSRLETPAPDEGVSAAARAYGGYLLTDRLSNRLPRSLLPLLGALVAVTGALLWTGALLVWGERLTGLGVLLVVGGVVAAACGLLSWTQRENGRLLVTANSGGQEL